MAKSNQSTNENPIAAFLSSLPQLPAVYDAKDFTNRAFTFESVEWKTFPPTERNNYSEATKAMIAGTEISTGRKVVIETTQKGIVNPIAALEEQGYFNVNLMIVQEGKFCTIRAV